jgi:glutathione S-transferase
MKLYQFPLSPSCQKVVAIAYEVGARLETVDLDIFRGQAKTPEMLAKNPNGKVPILEDGDFVLWESSAMLGYVARRADRMDLAPVTLRERADVDRWLAWSDAHLSPAVRKVAFERVVKKLAGLGAPDEAAVKVGSDLFNTAASVLDRSLERKEYLCGALTIADFASVPYAVLCESSGLDLAPYRNVQRWLERMLERDSMKRTLSAARQAA